MTPLKSCFIYNIPPRSIVDMTPETMAELARLPNVVGVKDATMDLGRPQVTRIAMNGDGDDFCFLSGEDGTAVLQPCRRTAGTAVLQLCRRGAAVA